MSSKFEAALKSTLNDQTSLTENGAVGFKTSGKALCDINFAVSSLRSASKTQILKMWQEAYAEDPVVAIKWLFMARDIRGDGMGERRLFRVILKELADTHADIVEKLVPVIADYGRYDDLWILEGTKCWGAVIDLVAKQLADDIEAEKAGKAAAEYVLSNYYTLWLQNQICDGCGTSTYFRKKGDIVKFLPPSPDGAAFKMGKDEVICTVCPNGCHLKVDVEHDYKVTGNGCPKGKAYGKAEFTNPTRVVTSTVKLKAAGENEALDTRIPVKTSNPIPKTKIMDLMKLVDEIELTERPEIGTVLIRDVLGLDSNLIVTKG